jgi:hypothetical protein
MILPHGFLTSDICADVASPSSPRTSRPPDQRRATKMPRSQGVKARCGQAAKTPCGQAARTPGDQDARTPGTRDTLPHSPRRLPTITRSGHPAFLASWHLGVLALNCSDATPTPRPTSPPSPVTDDLAAPPPRSRDAITIQHGPASPDFFPNAACPPTTLRPFFQRQVFQRQVFHHQAAGLSGRQARPPNPPRRTRSITQSERPAIVASRPLGVPALNCSDLTPPPQLASPGSPAATVGASHTASPLPLKMTQ